MKVLLIGPSSYGLTARMASKIQDLGHSVVVWDDRQTSSSFLKVALRTPLAAITRRILYPRFRQKSNTLSHVDLMIIINGEGISIASLEFIKSGCTPDRTVLYFWDNLQNKNIDQVITTSADEVFSFDPLDCGKYGFTYLPLFSPHAPIDEVDRQLNPPEFEIGFWGAIHSERIQFAHIIRNWADLHGRSVFIHLYSPSVFTTLREAVKNKGLIGFILREVRYHSLSLDKIKSLIDRSRYVLDIPHSKQSGLTMRAIEVQHLGGTLLTPAYRVRDDQLIDRPEVVTFDDLNDFLESDRMTNPEPAKVRRINPDFGFERWFKALGANH